MTRRWAGPAAAVATGLLAGLSGVRWALARRALAQTPAPTAADPAFSASDVDVLVPIRSGDPLLARRLAESAATLGHARVHLLVDDDDAPAYAAAVSLAARSADLAGEAEHGGRGDSGAERPLAQVQVEVFPPPSPAHNPKVEKLAAAVERLSEDRDLRPVLVQLDDDTALPPGGLTGLLRGLDDAELATAIPVYLEQGSVWSRLVAGFVNGSALVTYLPMARLAPPVSVNGMALAMRTADLASAGGYAAIARATCDDYALARAFRRRGLRIAQTTQPVLLATTVVGPREYLRIMRRWLLFAGEVVRRDPSPRLLLEAGQPSLLPLAAVVTAALVPGRRARTTALAGALGTVAVAQTGTWWLRRTLWRKHRGAAPGGPSARGLALEIAAALLTPVHLLAAIGPRTVTWRGRRVCVGVGE